MNLVSRWWAWIRRLLGPSGPVPKPRAAPPRLASLLSPGQLVRTASATIDNHVAVVTVRDPLPSLDALLEEALLQEAWGALREHPAEGPIQALEVWAPPGPGERPTLALRRRLAQPIAVSPMPSPDIVRARHQSRVPHVLTEAEDTPHATEPVPAGVGAEVAPRDERLRPLGTFLDVPPALAERLAGRGVAVSDPDLVSLVEALLQEAGYTVRRGTEHGADADLDASAGSNRAMVRCHRSHRLVPSSAVDAFGFAFLGSRADEGFFITDGLLPFEIRHWERDPRIHLLDRVGLQRLVRAVASVSA
jgi:hypothetical protein